MLFSPHHVASLWPCGSSKCGFISHSTLRSCVGGMAELKIGRFEGSGQKYSWKYSVPFIFDACNHRSPYIHVELIICVFCAHTWAYMDIKPHIGVASAAQNKTNVH